MDTRLPLSTAGVKDASSSRRQSRRVYDFPVETLLQYAHLRQDEAARALGVAPITLKRMCQRHQIRWPYRTVKARARRAATKLQRLNQAISKSHPSQADGDRKSPVREGIVPAIRIPPLATTASNATRMRRAVKLPSLVEQFGPYAVSTPSRSREYLMPSQDPVIRHPHERATVAWGEQPRALVMDHRCAHSLPDGYLLPIDQSIVSWSRHRRPHLHHLSTHELA